MQVYVGDVNNITKTVEFPLTFALFLRTALRTYMGSEKAFSFLTGAKKEQWLRLSRATGGREEEGGSLFTAMYKEGKQKRGTFSSRDRHRQLIQCSFFAHMQTLLSVSKGKKKLIRVVLRLI